MEAVDDQPDAENQFQNDGDAGYDEGCAEAEEAVAINIKLELVNADHLQDGRNNEQQSKQGLQYMCKLAQLLLWFVI